MPATRTAALTVTDETGATFNFSLAPSLTGETRNHAMQGALRYAHSVGYTVTSRPWEPADGSLRWRVPLHPWDGGLYQHRLGTKYPRTYSKGICDASWGTLLFPANLNSVTFANGNNPFKAVNFNNKVFFIGGEYIYYFDPVTNTATQDKDLGVGKAAVDIAVFNNELIVAMGETEKIWKRDTAGVWTQATDATFAIALGVVDSKLWRAETTNRVSSCSTTPLTLANWIPSGTSAYSVGDTTWAVNTIIDYGGIPWVLKGDGVYAPDPQSRFKNQTPQLRTAPNIDNGKGAFTAQGYLWVPSSSGLLRIKPGQSLIMGPELTIRPGYRFWVRGGVEYGGVIYILATDENNSPTGNTTILKMMKDKSGISRDGDYIFHDWGNLLNTTKGYCITVTTAGTNPKLVAGHGNNMKYIVMGRGGGRDIDDPNYQYAQAMELETGRFQPAEDLALVSTLVGVDVVLDYSRATESVYLEYAVDRIKNTDAYTGLLLTTQEGGGTQYIQGTTNYEKKTMYAPVNTQGQFFEVKFNASMSGSSGLVRPEILEAYAHGFSHPTMTHMVTCAVVAENNVWVNGVRNGISHDETIRKWHDWMNRGIVLTCKIQGYEENHTTRFRVSGVDSIRIETQPGQDTYNGDPYSIIKIDMVRIDYAGQLAVH